MNNSIVNLKDGFITFNSNIDNSLSFSKCAIGYSNYSLNSHERGALVFLTNNNANTTNVSMHSDIRMCIASDGNVGIGTNNPTQKLDIAGNVILSGTISGNGSLLTSINAANISSGTIDSLRLPVATTSVLGGVKKGNNINIDGNGIISVDLLSYNGDSTINNEGANSTLTIKQTTAGNTNNILNVINSATLNVFNVSSTGNAGIGTTNPNNRLHLHNTTANSDVGIRFSDLTSGASAIQGFTIGKNTAQQAYLWNYGNTDMLFATNNAERLRILANGNVGIGTNADIQSKLTINGINTNVANSFDHSEAPLTITNPTATSTSVLNDPKAVLNLCRTGTTGQTYSARACFKLCRYENDSVNSRTRLDITLAHNFYDELNIMSLLSGGNIGIGITNPVSRLHLHNTTANSDVAIRFTDSTSGAGATNGFVIGENSTQKAYLWNYGNTDMLFATNNVERMTISNAGNIGIGTNSALSSLHLHKNSTTQDVRMIISDNTSTSSLIRGLHLIKGTDNIGYLWNYENTPLILAANNAERLRILANGNVGIGTATPETILDVNGNLLIRAYGTSGSGTRGIFFRQGDFVTTNLYNCSILTFDHIGTGTTDGLSFNGFDGLSFCTGANSRQERMRITDTGNVGIGTNNPAYRTHIKCDYDDISKGLHLDASDSSSTNQYALTIYPYVVGGSQIGWKFRTQSVLGGTQTPLTFDHAGNVILGGTISGNGSLLTSINAANISSGTIDSLRIPAEYITETELTAKNYLTTIPTEYITETELTAKNYLTTIPAEYITETYLSSSTTKTIGGILQVGSSDGGGILRLGGTSDETGFLTAFIQCREYVSFKSEIVIFKGNDISGVAGPDRIRLRAGAIAFDTYGGSSSADATTESIRMFITGSGNVGIGTTDPASILHLHNTTANADVAIRFTNGNSGFLGTDGFIIGHVDSNGYIWNYETTGAIYFGTNNSESMRIIANGNVGIGTNNPATYKCQVNGDIGASGNVIAYYSDERLKNITEYIDNVLPILDKINVFKYNCNDLAESFGYDKSKKEIGLSAQEIQKYYPEIVSIAPFDADYDEETKQIISKSGENYLTLDYQRLVPVLLQAIKELNRKYTALEEKYNKIMPK